MDTYKETIDFLFNSLPVFQHQGPSAYKPGLDTARMLDDAFGNRYREFKTIHVGGTNGKGSTAHTIAAVLQSAGYRVGLYTSPHLIDFRERMRVNGEMISETEVVDFVERFRSMKLDCAPSFFELTTIMAFEFFARKKVDVAVIEVGLGGRLDTTNIISPELCVITNISLDHTALLGYTPEAIAGEKAGIMKTGVPVVIGEAEGGVKDVFTQHADEVSAPIIFAQEECPIDSIARENDAMVYATKEFGEIRGELTGDCQKLNAATILTALVQLKKMGWCVDAESVARGFGNVCALTGLMGRWMRVADEPLTICDTGHNPGGWELIARQLGDMDCHKRMVIGFVGDKDVSCVLNAISQVPDVTLYFTQPSIDRALPACELAAKAAKEGLRGDVSATVADAYEKALAECDKGDMVYVGGSTFVVADFLAYINR